MVIYPQHCSSPAFCQVLAAAAAAQSLQSLNRPKSGQQVLGLHSAPQQLRRVRGLELTHGLTLLFSECGPQVQSTPQLCPHVSFIPCRIHWTRRAEVSATSIFLPPFCSLPSTGGLRTQGRQAQMAGDTVTPIPWAPHFLCMKLSATSPHIARTK